MDAYIFNFNNNKDKVAQAYSELDLSGILGDGATLGEEEGEGAATKEENVGVKKPVIKGFEP